MPTVDDRTDELWGEEGTFESNEEDVTKGDEKADKDDRQPLSNDYEYEYGTEETAESDDKPGEEDGTSKKDAQEKEDEDPAGEKEEKEKEEDGKSEKDEKDEKEEKHHPITDALLQRAIEIGLTEEEAKSFRQDWRLEALLDRLEKAQGAKGEDADSAQDAESPAKEDDVELSEEWLDERLVKKHKATDTKLSSLEQENLALRSVLMQDQFDQLLTAKIGPEHEEFVGKGPRFLVDPAQFQNRSRIYAEFRNRQEVHARTRVKATIGQMFDEAVEIVLGKQLREKAKKATVDGVIKKIDRRAKQQIARATHRKGKSMSGLEKAAAFADQFYEERGIGGGSSGETF